MFIYAKKELSEQLEHRGYKKIKGKRVNNKCMFNIFNVVGVYREREEVKKIY